MIPGFLENSPFYSDIGKKVSDPRRTKKTEDEIPEFFMQDFMLRREMMLSEYIEERLLGKDGMQEERQRLNELLWGVLYPMTGLDESSTAAPDPGGCIIV